MATAAEADRAAVAEPKTGQALQVAVTALEKAKYEVKGEHYKQLPRGFEAADEFTGRMLRYNALWVGEDEAAPKLLSSGRFVNWAMTRWSKMEPLHRWLVDSVR